MDILDCCYSRHHSSQGSKLEITSKYSFRSNLSPINSSYLPRLKKYSPGNLIKWYRFRNINYASRTPTGAALKDSRRFQQEWLFYTEDHRPIPQECFKQNHLWNDHLCQQTLETIKVTFERFCLCTRVGGGCCQSMACTPHAEIRLCVGEKQWQCC